MVIYRNWISGLTHMNIWKLFTHIEKNYFWRRRLIIGPPPSPGGLQFLPALSLWDCQPWETVTNSCGVSREQTGLSGFLDDNSMDLNIPEVSHMRQSGDWTLVPSTLTAKSSILWLPPWEEKKSPSSEARCFLQSLAKSRPHQPAPRWTEALAFHPLSPLQY